METHERITLLGDAALHTLCHAPVGEGVNEAMFDAAKLAQDLMRARKLYDALDKYNTQVFHLSKTICKLPSHIFHKFYFTADGGKAALVNGLMSKSLLFELFYLKTSEKVLIDLLENMGWKLKRLADYSVKEHTRPTKIRFMIKKRAI